MIMLYAICGLTATLVCYLLSKYPKPPPTSVLTHRTPAAVKQLLNPARGSTHDLLVARAIPNERLVRAFRLTNTFVSHDLELHKSFLGRARSLLQTVTSRGWPHFQSIAIRTVDSALPAKQIPFDLFIQDITLRAMLVGLLQVDSDVNDFAREDVAIVSKLITDLWARSKTPTPIPPHLLKTLNTHLRRLMPDEEQYPNPLDFVIPVWETFWRVVAVAVYHILRDPHAKPVFARLHDNPTNAQFQFDHPAHNADANMSSKNTMGPSAQDFIAEVMRLYPPSKRIMRAVTYPHPLSGILPAWAAEYIHGPARLEAADMEAALRAPEMWGPDAAVFNPMRFLGRREGECMDAFGYGNLRCPAAKWAPMAAAVVAAAVVHHLDGERYALCDENTTSVGGRDGWGGQYVRTL